MERRPKTRLQKDLRPQGARMNGTGKDNVGSWISTMMAFSPSPPKKTEKKRLCIVVCSYSHLSKGEHPIHVTLRGERLHGGRERLLPGGHSRLRHPSEDHEGSRRVARTPAIGSIRVRNVYYTDRTSQRHEQEEQDTALSMIPPGTCGGRPCRRPRLTRRSCSIRVRPASILISVIPRNVCM